jgi:predicted dehydrogenase
MKIAVAGLGWWGQQIVDRLRASDRFEILYGVDPMPPPEGATLARERGFKLEADLAPVLRDPAVEGVILVTPHALHEGQIVACVAAGKNVFCEKPLTLTAAGARRAVEACVKAGRVLGIGHERRWEPGFEEVARLVKSGALGKILHMDANVSHDLFRRMAPSNWRLDPAHAPAGMMTAVGIHLTDLFIDFAGPVREVRAMTARMVLAPPAEDYVTAHIDFVSGTRATLTSLSTTPYYGRFTVFGDQGWAELVHEANVDKNKPTILTADDGTGRRSKSFEAIDTVTLNLDSWADAVAGRAPYRFTPEQMIENVRLFEAIVQSSRQSGTAVAL